MIEASIDKWREENERFVAGKAYLELSRKFSAEKRKQLAQEGKALADGSFPIVNLTDLKNAVSAWGRANPSDRQKVKRHILKRAKALGASKELMDRIRNLGKS